MKVLEGGGAKGKYPLRICNLKAGVLHEEPIL